MLHSLSVSDQQWFNLMQSRDQCLCPFLRHQVGFRQQDAVGSEKSSRRKTVPIGVTFGSPSGPTDAIEQ
jgi:hypothetical protein